MRWGMVGGGRGSEIGYIHRAAAARDGMFFLQAGAFDLDFERGKSFGTNIGVSADRCYPDYMTMFSEESKRPDGIQAVSITTPNSTHYEISKAALMHGLHVVCEKPLCFTHAESEELVKLSLEKNRVFGVTYGYTGAQMIHQAKHMIANGDLGEIRIIDMQFAHGFHSEEVEKNSPGAKWRVTPAVAGPTYVLGDLGTHVYYLSELLVPELKIDELLCTRQSFIKSRAPLEDNATVLIRYQNGAVGTLWASAVNAGSMHQQKIRVIGSKASIEWWDEHPNQLRYEIQGAPAQILERGMGYLEKSIDAVGCDRIGGGHAEGLFESWANLYNRFGQAMDMADAGQQVEDIIAKHWYPNVFDGSEGVRFLEHCVKSSDAGSIWVQYS